MKTDLKKNQEDRMAFVKLWAEKMKTLTDKEWSEQQKTLIDSQIQSSQELSKKSKNKP